MRNLLPLILSLLPFSSFAQIIGPHPLLNRLSGTWVGECQFMSGWYLPLVKFDPAHHQMTYQRVRYGGREGCNTGRPPSIEDAGSGEFQGTSEDVTKVLVSWHPGQEEWTIEEFAFTSPQTLVWTRAARFRVTPNGWIAPWGSNYHPGRMRKVADNFKF
jgi:hypothetical protein